MYCCYGLVDSEDADAVANEWLETIGGFDHFANNNYLATISKTEPTPRNLPTSLENLYYVNCQTLLFGNK